MVSFKEIDPEEGQSVEGKSIDKPLQISKY